MYKAIRKAIIPAAGFGTRFLPATKAQPKEMLPIIDKPVIQYIVEEAVYSGIEQIVIVTGRNKQTIENHFDTSFELEYLLKHKNKTMLLKQAQDITNIADIYYVRQKEALGLGHAIWCARNFIGDEPFAVLLGDVISKDASPCLKQLIDNYAKYHSSIVAVEAVPWKDTEKYGIIDGTPIDEKNFELKDLVEKPLADPPSNYAIIGRYIIQPEIFDILGKTTPGVGGEIQLTDALKELLKTQKIIANQYDGKCYDVGSKIGFLKATIDFALDRSELKAEFLHYLSAVLKGNG